MKFFVVAIVGEDYNHIVGTFLTPEEANKSIDSVRVFLHNDYHRDHCATAYTMYPDKFCLECYEVETVSGEVLHNVHIPFTQIVKKD